MFITIAATMLAWLDLLGTEKLGLLQLLLGAGMGE